MKDLLKTIGILFTITAILWTLSSVVPKVIDIYKEKPELKTDTVFQRDTLWLEKEYQDSMPKHTYETITKRDTIYKQVGDSVEATPRFIILKKKDYEKTDTIGEDTIKYQASVSGYGYEGDEYPKLDSIKLFLRHQKIKEVQVITNTITERQRARKWHLGAFAGYGYGVTTKKPDAFIGVGITYNIW